jgi:hypothetical protein
MGTDTVMTAFTDKVDADTVLTEIRALNPEHAVVVIEVENRRCAYFVQRTVTNENGEFIPCLAVEGKKGYKETNWTWGKDFKLAEECAQHKNEMMGLSKKEALLIVCSTM